MQRLFVLIALLSLLLTSAPAGMQDAPDARIIPLDLPLRWHSAPSLVAETSAVVEPGTDLNVIGRTRDSEWLQVRATDGSEGWMMVEFAEVLVDLNRVAVTTDLSELPHDTLEFTPAVIKRIRKIFASGQSMGNRAGVFSKVGDSITAAPHLLNPIGEGLYNLGDFQYLQGVIDTFSATATDEAATSFNHLSLAAGIGWPAHAAVDEKFADAALCESGETPLTCEYRLIRPSIALIMFGTNDVSRFSASMYEGNLQEIVQTSIQMGVIPVISTIPNRVGYEDQVLEFNQVIDETARQFSIPLWNYYAAMELLPNEGLDTDGTHPTIPPRGYKGAADFRQNNLYYGYVVRNLTALQMLEAVEKVFTSPAN